MFVFGDFLVRIFPHSNWIQKIQNIYPYSVRMRENADQKNSEYGHFSRSDTEWNWWISCTFSLGKIPKFRLISCCGNFVEAPSFRRVSGQSRNFGISSSSSFNNLFWNQFIFENIHRKKINNFSLIFCCRKELISEACLEPN